ncbi:MAG: MobF family relaxase, partial [Ilumatobacteraceae bacterium]
MSVGVVLSIAKLRVGQEAYHLSGVAESLDAYYTGAGEANGVWVGGGAKRLGLDGDVMAEDLQAVLAGLAPGVGGLTPNGDRQHPHPRRVPGFDLTFKAPKSASVLYAVSDDPRVQGAIIEAGEVAMAAAIGWIEREAIRVRRGSHNQAWLAAHADEPGAGPRQLPTSGVVAASFRHRTSRAGDPLLHWHTLVANLAEGTDGKWSAFTHPDLYRHVRAAGEVFQA